LAAKAAVETVSAQRRPSSVLPYWLAVAPAQAALQLQAWTAMGSQLSAAMVLILLGQLHLDLVPVPGEIALALVHLIALLAPLTQ
jgi:hypothetical protein